MGQLETLPETPADRVDSALSRLFALPESERRIGPFVLIRQLGRGGFAPVWLAREQYGTIELRAVALKVFRLEAAGPGSLIGPQSRFTLEEARALCQVEHPNVVRFYSIALDQRRGLMGLAMEYLGGRPLDQTLERSGPLPVSDAIDLALSVASALSAVHRNGVVHRDIKPANIVDTGTGYKLIDFGIARGPAAGTTVHEAEDVPLSEVVGRRFQSTSPPTTSPVSRLPELMALCGTMGYMDPECIARSAPANAESDLYALGATLFEVLTGRLPAERDAVLQGEVLDGRAMPSPVASLRPDAPAEFCKLIDTLLQPRRAERPRSAEWVASRAQEIRHQLAGKPRRLPAEQVGPFRGLARFEAVDQAVYFGRTLEVAQALQVLRVRGLVALLGPSGSGKSSLARAGLVPAILDGELAGFPERWDSVIVAPGIDPRRTVLSSLEPLIGCVEESPRSVLSALAERAQVESRGVVLVVDQLEELATLAHGSSRDWLVEFLALLAEQPLPGVRSVATARRDLLDPLLGLSGLGRALLPNSVLIEPMTALTWIEVLERALAAYGYSWQSEELKQCVALEIERTASAMPLVQFALGRLWDLRDSARKVLTSRSFEQMGGIAGALTQHAESILSQLSALTPDAQAAARPALLALTTAQGTSAVRELADIEREAGDLTPVVLEAFERARLVVRLPSGYTLAHEVLLSEWPRLQSWLAEGREARLLGEELAHDAARWKLDPELVPLWSQRRLAMAQDVLRRGGIEIREHSRAFLTAGLRAERRRRWVIGSLVIAASAALLVLGGAYVRGIQSEKALTHAALARERDIRGLAEARTRDVQRAQRRIDELLRGMSNSPAKAEVLSLQQQIREAPAPQPRALRGRARAPGDRGVDPDFGPDRDPVLVAPPASSESVPNVRPIREPRIRVQNEW
ncbi:MAG: serine/threonine-protein kinase [Myxococcales bacterium]